VTVQVRFTELRLEPKRRETTADDGERTGAREGEHAVVQ
jgi:hypothetical protein